MRCPSQARTTLLLPLLLACAGRVHAETDAERATRLIKAKGYSEAQQVIDRMLQGDARNAEAMGLMGELQMRLRNPKKAVEWADKAIQLAPSRARFHVLRGNAYGVQAQEANFLKAMTMVGDIRGSYEKAVQLEPRNREARGALFSFYLNAPSVAGGGQDKAWAFAEQTVPLDAGLGHFWKGLLLQRKKDPGAAQAAFRLAVAADPKLTAAYNGLGYVELEMKQLDVALEHFRKQVELDPENPNSHDSLGDGLLAKGRLEEGIAAYRKALALNPLFVASLRSLGKALEQAGRRDEAIAHYRHCLQVGQQQKLSQMVTEAKARLKGLGVAA